MKICICIFLFIASIARASGESCSTDNLVIHIVFGYKDARPARFVGDRYERLFMLQKLTSPCPDSSTQACGFSRDQEDSTLLEKEIFRPGQAPAQVQIHITNSSVGADDDDNRRNPYQKHLSQISENNFFYSLNEAQAVFYVGHSRDGGGPDFNPPRLGRHNHVNYAWYKKHRPGLKRLLAQLKPDPRSKQKLELGLYSCASTQLFAPSIHQKTSQVQLITEPELLYYSEALERVLVELSRVIKVHFANSSKALTTATR